MFRKALFIALPILLWASQGIAGDCKKLWPHAEKARQNIIDSFVQYDLRRLGRETENLIFWDTYIQTECSQGRVQETPVVWLSRQGQRVSPYTAGFLFWIEDIRDTMQLDITPMGLIRGRKFE